MQTRNKSDCFMKGIALLMILVIYLRTINGQNSEEKYNRGNAQLSRAHARAREVRGIRPGNLQTARDFGKRDQRFEEMKDVQLDRQTKRYPSQWFLEQLRRHPGITREYERILLKAGDRRNLTTKILLESIKIL
ncbi:uncharacterized protein LOC107040707 [Diachasma alloeum]|uniref:uncharacterized protein LOC107040707 n=1 Tax=Diachasma alloeum TaxID=454923 RepID=UPI0007384C12|nr:uncharacterized protein LOC107040707 [Diachasma alloeum]